MRYVLLQAVFVAIFCKAYPQQGTINLKNAVNGKKIEYAIISNQKRFNLAVIQNGRLTIAYKPDLLADTLFIDAAGYKGYKATLADMLKQKNIALVPNTNPLKDRPLKFEKVEKLNGYTLKNVNKWVGFPTDEKPFNYLQIGQIFPNTHQAARLTKIKLNQLYFYLENTQIFDDGSIVWATGTYALGGGFIFKEAEDKGYMRSYWPDYLQSNIFRLRIYQVDLQNQPTVELSPTPIIIDIEPPVENININLSKYNIMLPYGRFMVAVEWMPTRKNLNYIIWAKNMFPMGQSLRPFIGVSEDSGVQLNVMALDYGGNWKPFSYLSPYYTDLAMECTMAY